MEENPSAGDLAPAVRDPHLPVLEYGTAGPARVPGPPRPPVVRLLLIGVLLLPLTVALGYPIASLLPWGWECGAVVEMPTSIPGAYGGSIASFDIVANGTGRGSRARMERGYVKFASPGLFGSIDVDFRAMTYRSPLARSGPTGYRPLARDALLRDFVVPVGFQPASPEASAVADALLGELRKLGEGRLPPDVTGQPYAGQLPASRHWMAGDDLVNLGEYGHLLWWPWYGPYCLPVWAVAWWFAARPLMRRYRRRFTEYDGTAPRYTCAG